MGELGELTLSAHDDAGTMTASLKIGALVALGTHAERIVAAATSAGMDTARTYAARAASSWSWAA